MKRTLRTICLLAILVGFASCGVKQGIRSSYSSLSYKAQATLSLDEHNYSMVCQVQNWHNQLLILSLQPLAGVEMARLEATNDSVWVFDKMNRKYSVLSYEQIGSFIQPAPSLKMMQEYVQGKGMADPNLTEKEFRTSKHRIAIRCEVKDRAYDVLKEPTRIRTDKYQRVPLKELLPL